MRVSVVPGATPGPLTHIPVDKFVVPASVSAEAPLAARAGCETEAVPPAKIKMPVPELESGPERLSVEPETLVTVGPSR